MEVRLAASTNADGLSVIELLIVVAMISVLSGFAILQVARARNVMSRANAAREFAAYLEKARLDSIRRRPATTSQMAQMAIIDSTSYSVTLDSDGDGVMEAPRVKSLPANSGLTFNGPFPRTIIFNWRGRTVDALNNVTTPVTVTISNSYGASTIDVSNAGQPALDTTITSSPVSNSTAPAPSFRDKTQIP